MSKLHSKAMDDVFEAIVSLTNIEECYEFFEDLCTIKEMKDMAQRYQVASLLSQGYNYQQIVDETKVSSSTVGRVKRCLEYGSGGYEKILSRNKEK